MSFLLDGSGPLRPLYQHLEARQALSLYNSANPLRILESKLAASPRWNASVASIAKPGSAMKPPRRKAFDESLRPFTQQPK